MQTTYSAFCIQSAVCILCWPVPRNCLRSSWQVSAYYWIILPRVNKVLSCHARMFQDFHRTVTPPWICFLLMCYIVQGDIHLGISYLGDHRKPQFALSEWRGGGVCGASRYLSIMGKLGNKEVYLTKWQNFTFLMILWPQLFNHGLFNHGSPVGLKLFKLNPRDIQWRWFICQLCCLRLLIHLGPCFFFNCRCVYNGALWYHNHFKQTLPIIVLTEDSQVIN